MNKRIAIRDKALTSSALRLLTEEYPFKFDEIINWRGIVEGETIKLIGNFDIMETEVHKRDIEFNGETKNYTIILKKKD